VPPGQEGKIELAVEHTDGYAGEVAKSASVSTNDPKMPNFNLTLRVRFKVEVPPGVTPPVTAAKRIGPFLVEPSDRWIAAAIRGTSTATSLYLVNQQDAPVRIKEVVQGGDSFVAQITPIQEGRRYELRVSSNPQLKPGHYAQTLRVVTDNPANPEMQIELDLNVYAKVFASPSSLVLPAMPANAELSNVSWPTVFIRKLRDGGLQIKSCTSTLPFLKTELVTEAEGQVYRIRLTVDQKKVAAGAYRGVIRIETNDPDSPVLEIPVSGSFN
jgi:hypothetical protein